jgi:hypothetical protein
MVTVLIPMLHLNGGIRPSAVDGFAKPNGGTRLSAISYFSLPDQQALSASGHSL